MILNHENRLYIRASFTPSNATKDLFMIYSIHGHIVSCQPWKFPTLGFWILQLKQIQTKPSGFIYNRPHGSIILRSTTPLKYPFNHTPRLSIKSRASFTRISLHVPGSGVNRCTRCPNPLSLDFWSSKSRLSRVFMRSNLPSLCDIAASISATTNVPTMRRCLCVLLFPSNINETRHRARAGDDRIYVTFLF